MSAFGLSIEYRIGNESGPDSMQRLGVAFERAGAELVNLGKHVFPLLTPIFEAAETRQFEAEGRGPVSGDWAPLSAAYAAWKDKHYPGQPKLVRTGALKSALTASASALGSREWTASSFVFGTQGIEHASLHQTGTSRMPPRPPFDLDSEFQDDLKVAARKGVNGAIRESSLDSFVGEVPEGA